MVAQSTANITITDLVFTENYFSSTEISDLVLFYAITSEGFLTIESSNFERNTIETDTNPVYLFDSGVNGNLKV